jgi:hypothetical protein
MKYSNALMLLAVPALLAWQFRADAQGEKWGTIKGQVIWGGDTIPPRTPIDVTKNNDKDHCLKDNPTANVQNGTILDEVLLINAKNKGIKNVFVWLINDPDNPLPIHPDFMKFPREVEIDQPSCMFFPRAIAIREGQVLVVKNTSPVQHNIRWTGDSTINQGGNVIIKPQGKQEIKDLKAQRLPLLLDCNIHGWMKGRLAVLNHPYYAITDKNGSFEIPNAPVGKWKIMIYHEEMGYRLGAAGNKGEPIAVSAGVNDMGLLKMGGAKEK